MRYSILLPVVVTASLVAAPLAIGGTPVAASTLPAYGVMWTVDSAANSLSEYAPNAHGAATPIATISGIDTGLNDPTGVALGPAGGVYVSNAGNDSITKYAADANGDAKPIATISGAKTGLDEPQGLTISDGEAWVVDPPSNVVEAFSADSSGDQLPAETIAGPRTQLSHPTSVSITDGEIVTVANTPTTGPATLTAYFTISRGNIKPDLVVKGTSTDPLTTPSGILGLGFGEAWVADSSRNRLTDAFLLPGLGGDLEALRTIHGPATGLNHPSGIATDALGNLVVTNAGDHTVRVFARTAKGNAAPIRTVTGLAGDPGSPEAATVFGVAPGAPTGLKVSVHGTTATMSWKPPVDTGGGVIGYDVAVFRNDSDDDGLLNVEFAGENVDGTEVQTTRTTFTRPHLKRGDSYAFGVVAVNAFGGSESSHPVEKTLVSPPSPPRHVSATSGHHSIVVHWTKPTNDGGQKITSYDVEYSTCAFGAKGCSFTSYSVGGTHSFVTIHGLKAGTSYRVRVVAKNQTKLGRPSRVVRATPVA